MAGRVTVQYHHHVATVALDNPGKLNALTADMWQQAAVLFRELSDDPSVRVVVLRGEGDHFCAGSDIVDLQAHHNSGLPSLAEEAIAGCVKPVIAAVAGHCLGGGLQLAAACDIRLASSESHYGVPPAKLGIVYPLSATRRLVSMVGAAATKYLIFTGDRIDATRALHIGLVDEMVGSDLLFARAAHVASQVAELSQLTVQATKEIVDHLVAGTLEESLVDAWVAEADAGADLPEGIASFQARRRPHFTWTRH